MNIIESFKMAAGSILSNKLRSFLTMLGIIIGIASVIAIVAIGEGGKVFISSQFEKIGMNVVEIKLGDNDISAGDLFTLDDIRNIKIRIPNVKAATTMVNKWGTVKNNRVGKEAIVTGVTGDYDSVFSIEMLYGRFINENDVLTGKNAIVIDSSTAQKLFGYTNCIGKLMKVGGKLTQTNALIVGVMKSDNEFIAGLAGENMPILTYVPVTFINKMFPEDFAISQIAVGVHDHLTADSTANSIIRLLEKTHHNSEKYSAQNLMKQLDRVNSIMNKFTAIISAIAAISLIVGGIGVMNIMLVSVSERTREIGIRKAIGATKGNILLQFLTEAVIISMIGGIFGLFIGFVGGITLGKVIGLIPHTPPWIVLLVVGLTSLVGIFFGIYPANKASNLDPIEALRYE